MAIVEVGEGSIRARAKTSTRREGDFAIDLPAAELTERRRAFVDLPWVWLRQVHGAEVVVAGPGDLAGLAGAEADGIVTRDSGVVLAVHTADCVPVVFACPGGVIGAAHAGWQGLEAGVIGATLDAMRGLGADLSRVCWFVGPHIGPECYEFGDADLDRFERCFGTRVRGRASSGSPSLDLGAAVLAAITRAGGLGGGSVDPRCTACEAGTFYSHRARGDSGRMATVVWIEKLRAGREL